METKHKPATRLPWVFAEAFAHPRAWHVMPEGRQFCIASVSRDENAAYITHASNAYPKLVEALRELLQSSPNEVDITRLLQFSGLDDVDELRKKRELFGWRRDNARALLRELGESV